MNLASKSWFEILKAARILSVKAPFASADLARAAGLKDTFPSVITRGNRIGEMGKGSTAEKIAAGWLSKFKKWGYAEVVEKVMTGGPKPTFAWRLTEEGMKCELKDGIRKRFDKLLEASKALRELKGKKSEPEAWKDFLSTLAEVDGKEEEKA